MVVPNLNMLTDSMTNSNSVLASRATYLWKEHSKYPSIVGPSKLAQETSEGLSFDHGKSSDLSGFNQPTDQQDCDEHRLARSIEMSQKLVKIACLLHGNVLAHGCHNQLSQAI